jgi:hypothetical protein
LYVSPYLSLPSASVVFFVVQIASTTASHSKELRSFTSLRSLCEGGGADEHIGSFSLGLVHDPDASEAAGSERRRRAVCSSFILGKTGGGVQ